MRPVLETSPAVSGGNQRPICVWTGQTFLPRMVTELDNFFFIHVTIGLHYLAAKLLILRTPVP
jgi:hypothetical protein